MGFPAHSRDKEPAANHVCQTMLEPYGRVFLYHPLHRKKGYRVAEALEYLFDMLKYSLLFRIFLGVAEEYLPVGECPDLFFQAFLSRQHTGRHDCDVIKLCSSNRPWGPGQSVSERPEILISHTKLVCSITFLAFCLPRCT
jgi:hypothetical protein